MAERVTLQFDDGTTAEIELRMPLMVQAERHFKGAVPALEGTLWCCWKHLKPGLPFDQWMDTVDDMSKPDGEAVSAPLVEEPEPDT